LKDPPKNISQRPAAVHHQGDPTYGLKTALDEDALVQQDDRCLEQGDGERVEDTAQEPPHVELTPLIFVE